jgi:peptidoglycan/xylan/chitin deacetylase (PgdA/CDA1 family)
MKPDAIACFTFDNMAEAADVGAGTLSSPRSDPVHPSLALGYPNFYSLLDRYGVRATFFVEGWNGVHHPEAVAEITKRGHELGMHGWTHEVWHELEPEREAELAARATEALAEAAGARPRGFRAPGGQRSLHTEGILRDLGYRYDASLGDGMHPAVLKSGLAQVPFVWQGVDGFYYLRSDPRPAAEVRDTWLRQLDRVAATGGLYLLICHAFITGVDAERLQVLEDVMRAALADERLRVLTAGEVADEVRAAADGRTLRRNLRNLVAFPVVDYGWLDRAVVGEHGELHLTQPSGDLIVTDNR